MATATATCGWCKTKNLAKVPFNSNDGQGLETHTIPNSRRKCEGQSTAPGYHARTKR